jgi:hypothetical protein
MVRHGHFLDGRIFSGNLVSQAGHSIPEQISFRDTKFRSLYLLRHGYAEIFYEAFKEKTASEAERTLFNLNLPNPNPESKETQLHIDGQVNGDDLQLKIALVKNHQTISQLFFTGSSHQIRPDTMPLGTAPNLVR